MITRAIFIGMLFIGLTPVLGLAIQTPLNSDLESQLAPGNGSTRAKVTIMAGDNQWQVKLDDALFTAFDFKTYNKPILYPIYAPGQIAMTRDWPMKDGTEGESRDHPHHKSMWISHEISGIDFWSEKGGTVKTESIEKDFVGNPTNVFRATSAWIRKSDSKTILTDQTTYWFGGDQTSRWINCQIDYRATHGDFEFDDTKEGLFAIRTHPDLRLTAKPKSGVEQVFGNATNSEGVTGKNVWGKQAKWLLYYGLVDGQAASIAMYDHPNNLRHPTTWHARDYGLVTANPFGLHHFLGAKKGSGVFKVKSGDNLELRYRVEFFQGIATPDMVQRKYESFAKQALPSLTVRQR